jgi:hypothetical protein
VTHSAAMIAGNPGGSTVSGWKLKP